VALVSLTLFDSGHRRWIHHYHWSPTADHREISEISM